MVKDLFKKLTRSLLRWLARQLPDCKRMTRLFGESLDRRTSVREKFVMKLHLFTCQACERYLDQILFIKQALHAHDDPESGSSDDGLSPESRSRLTALLRTFPCRSV